jgi:hypothetical protein
MALTDRDEPKEGVVTEHVAHIIAEATVIGLLHVEGLVFLIALLAKLNRGVGCRH